MNEMTGESLYEMYARTQIMLNNCIVETWDEMPDDERAVWIAISEELSKNA